MNDWIDQLRQAGAVIAESHDEVITDSAAGTRIVPLLHQGVIAVRGADSDKFLQGQLSCDVAQCRQRGSSLGAHCNIKGHMVALWRLLAIEDGFLLRTERDNLAAGLANLKKYIIFSKAEAADLSDSLVGLGLLGPDAAALAAQAVGQAPAEVDQCIHHQGRVAAQVPGHRYELWLPVADAMALLPELLAQATLGSTNVWRLAEIQAGIATVCAATREAFIPQMTNLQALNGVSFSKGCYTGQEIVTRLQHRGMLKRPMYRARLASDELPGAGTALHSPEKASVGQVVQAARNGDQVELLAVILKESAEKSPILLDGSEGPALELLPLPYELDPRLFESKR